VQIKKQKKLLHPVFREVPLASNCVAKVFPYVTLPAVTKGSLWKGEGKYYKEISSWGGEPQQEWFVTTTQFIIIWSENTPLSPLLKKEWKNQEPIFELDTHHCIESTPFDIEMNILRNVLVNFVLPNQYREYLEKISTCTFTNGLNEKETEKVIQFTKRQNGKWYFKPESRCEIVNKLIQHYPFIASQVHKEKPFFEKSHTSEEINKGFKKLSDKDLIFSDKNIFDRNGDFTNFYYESSKHVKRMNEVILSKKISIHN
tara:strand:- start:251 stop:1024 length:774 start_codon:yes stop_codon:yes gene_type:complete